MHLNPTHIITAIATDNSVRFSWGLGEDDYSYSATVEEVVCVCTSGWQLVWSSLIVSDTDGAEMFVLY